MTQYKTLNVKLSNSRLNKLKSGVKYGTEKSLNFSSNTIGDSNNETSFPHKLLLIDRLVSNLGKAFVNNSAANINLSKTQLLKMAHLGEFIGKILGPLLKPCLTLMKNILNPLAKCIFIPLWLTSALSAKDSYSKENV